MFLILAFQLYLWVHLHELAPKLSPNEAGWSVAWIGIYETLAGRTLFILSAMFLPVATIIMLGLKASALAKNYPGLLVRSDPPY